MLGRGEEGPLCDPESELRTTGKERESSARIINGMEKKKIYIYWYICSRVR